MIGQNGIELIKSFEGFSETEYLCPAGKRTIGYGHVLDENEFYPQGITPTEAEIMLLDDISHAESALNNLKDKLSGNQYDALVSLVYNIGEGAFVNSTMYDYIRSGDLISAAGEFPRWCKIKRKGSRGLLKRRIKEMELFLNDCLEN